MIISAKGILPLVQYIVDYEGTLRDALLVLERETGIAMVTQDERLIGVLADREVRRALLSGATLDSPLSPFVRPQYVSVRPTALRVEVLELMRAHQIEQIPIVDAQGRLHGLHRFREIVGVTTRKNWAVVMAGGRGSRLGGLTEHVPKPMIRIAGRPILERIVLHLVGHGIRRIFLAINYLGHVIEDYFENGESVGAQIEYLREESPAGTGGALSLLPEVPEHPLLVMNGDLVTQVNLGAMFAAHEQGVQVATMGVRRYLHTVPFGCVEVRGDKVLHMEEKPTLNRIVNAGIYILEPALLARVPRGQAFALPTLLEGCIQRGERIRSFEIMDDWVDIGQREQLRQQGVVE